MRDMMAAMVVVVVVVVIQFHLQSQVDSARFVSYMCEQVLPQFDEISSNEEGADPQLEILKLFAELCTHCGSLENSESRVEKVFERLIVSKVVFFAEQGPYSLNTSQFQIQNFMCLSFPYVTVHNKSLVSEGNPYLAMCSDHRAC
jgi:hypothetical protein